MAVLEVLKFPDSRLRTKCTPVVQITPELLRLADDMLETMEAHHGIGLSAIQVNHFVRLLTTNTLSKLADDRYKEGYISGEYEKKIEQPMVLFNPEIVKREGHIIFKEGCLSFPSYYADIHRSAIIEVQGLDREGRVQKFKTDGVLAVCIQHEIDHLDGKLFIDHLSTVKAQLLRAKIKKHGYPDKQQSGVL